MHWSLLALIYTLSSCNSILLMKKLRCLECGHCGIFVALKSVSSFSVPKSWSSREDCHGAHLTTVWQRPGELKSIQSSDCCTRVAWKESLEHPLFSLPWFSETKLPQNNQPCYTETRPQLSRVLLALFLSTLCPYNKDSSCQVSGRCLSV